MSGEPVVLGDVTLDAGRMVRFASQILHLGETLGEAGRVIQAVDPGGPAFGADGPGALGELGRHLHRRWVADLLARDAEARREGAQLVETAERLGKATANYVDTDIVLSTELARATADSAPGPLRDALPPVRTVTIPPDRETP